MSRGRGKKKMLRNKPQEQKKKSEKQLGTEEQPGMPQEQGENLEEQPTNLEEPLEKPEEEQKKVEEQPANSVVKLPSQIKKLHPLQQPWYLWYYKFSRGDDFEKSLIKVGSIDTVEEFWCLFECIQFINQLALKCGYYFFKEGIRPMWEDDTNREGGRLVINNNTAHRHYGTDQYWMDILLCLIGEAFGDYNHHICGAFVVRKPGNDRLGVWTTSSKNRAANMKIGNIIKSRTGYKGLLNFEPHNSAQNEHRFDI